MTQDTITTHTGPVDTEAEEAQALIRKIAMIALLSIALGIVIQSLVIGVKLAAAANLAWANVVVDMVGGVTWAIFVCAGVGIGTSIVRAKPALGGLLALVFAPIGIAMAKSSQKLVSGLTGAIEQQAILSLGTISVLRAVEYGILGWLLTRLVQKSEKRAWPFFQRGILVGIICGGGIAYVIYRTSVAQGLTPGAPQIATAIINEVVFPIGCATVIYIAQLVGRSAKVIKARS